MNTSLIIGLFGFVGYFTSKLCYQIAASKTISQFKHLQINSNSIFVFSPWRYRHHCFWNFFKINSRRSNMDVLHANFLRGIYFRRLSSLRSEICFDGSNVSHAIVFLIFEPIAFSIVASHTIRRQLRR